MNTLSPKKIAIIVELATSYKEAFYKCLFNNTDNLHVDLFCQAYIPDTNLKSIHEKYPDNIKLVNFLSIKKNTLIWQFLPYLKLYSNYNVYVFGGNPRYVSPMLFAIFLKLIGKKVVIWNLAHSHRNNKTTENIRLKIWKFFDNFLMYTDGCISFLQQVGFKQKNFLSINNGLDQSNIKLAIDLWNEKKLSLWQADNDLQSKIIILSCGRLNRKNAHEQLIKHFHELVKCYPQILWCIIGDGSERLTLEDMSKKLGFNNHIKFLGSIYTEEELAPWFLSAKLFVHPAAIGLSLFHAFGYGLPVITHDLADEHGPEFYAFKNGENGVLYKKSDPDDLVKTLLSLLKDTSRISDLKSNAAKIPELYNTNIMYDRFKEMILSII